MNTKEFISRRATRIQPSASIAARAIVERLRRDGRTIFDFTIGEPDFTTPPHIATAGIRAIEKGLTHYTPSSGISELKNAVCARLRADDGLSYEASDIVVGVGAKQLIFHAFAASLDDGDEVVIPAPYWVSYPDMVAANGGIAKIVPCGKEHGFKIQPEQLAGAIGPKTKWLVLNSPNNPSGAVYSRAELASLADVLRDHPGVWVLSDEIYQALVYGSPRSASFAQAAPHLRARHLLINGVSKAYAMTGWRIGYGAGPKELIDAMVKLISQSTTCPSAISQWAAVEALTADQRCVEEMRAAYETRRDLLCRELGAIDGMEAVPPEGAFYVFASVAGLIGRRTPDGTLLEDGEQVALYILESAGVAAVAGRAYGMDAYLRFSFAASEATILDGARALRRAVTRLN